MSLQEENISETSAGWLGCKVALVRTANDAGSRRHVSETELNELSRFLQTRALAHKTTLRVDTSVILLLRVW